MPPQPLKQQVSDWVADLQSEIENATTQAEQGPYFPERGITKESLLSYAESCKAQLERPEASLREALKGSPTF